MNILKYISRSLIYYRRTHFWVVLGTMVSTAILTGALITGDSIRYSLRQIVFDRLGNTEFALSSSDRFFNTQTAAKLSEKLRTPAAPLLQTKGIAITGGGKQRANNVQVIGVDNRFGKMGNIPEIYEFISANEAIINSQLALHMQLKIGDEFLLRMENLDYIPKDVPLALDSETSYAKRFTVRLIVSEKEFGRFNLKADQISPNTVFVSLDFLGQELGLENKANVLLVAGKQDKPLSVEEVNEAFKEVWSLSDAGYELIQIPDNNQIQMTSERIFLDQSVVNSALNIYENSQQIFTYFVNEIRLKDRAAPYSFVTAQSDLDLEEDEIFINKWLADDLNAGIGDQVELTYYVLGESRLLVEKTSDFRVKSIVPVQGVYADRNLMPDFPGLANTENCRDWDPGIPIDLNKIRDKDEDYWDTYRGTPKVFVSLSTAQNMWKNRFGNLTALRFTNEEKDGIEENLTSVIDPASLGFYFRNVKSEGLRASSQSVDFAQLFLGLSFFVIISALLLTGLLYVFNIEQRSEESGLFLALGFAKKAIKRFILLEGIILVIVGSFFGAICGVLYNQIVLIALKTIWQEIVGTSYLQIHVRISTLILGALSGILITLFTIWLVIRNQLKQPVAGLQKGITKLVTIGKKSKLSLAISIICISGVVLMKQKLWVYHDMCPSNL
ncbi:FtsX-like permease family protein, partial [candidate division KSB1 bacterium]